MLGVGGVFGRRGLGLVVIWCWCCGLFWVGAFLLLLWVC